MIFDRHRMYYIQIKSTVVLNCSFDEIFVCQDPTRTNRTLLYISWSSAGFGSELNQILLAFAYSVRTNRRFLIDSQAWNYGRFSDYFNFPSLENHSPLNYTFITENHADNDRVDHLKTTRFGPQLVTFSRATLSVHNLEMKRHVAHFLWKSISSETLTFIRTHRLQSLSNYIGIHVRRGDKHKESPAVPLEKYIDEIEEIY